ncbi:MAG: apolipoprotein N-acyltransferase [Bacteroidota bacterium]
MSRRIRLSMIFLGLVTTLGSAWRIWQLWEQEMLWGRWPLLFYLGAWLSLVGLRASFGANSNSVKHWRWLGLSVASGVALSLGFPPLPTTFLMFIGFVPLLLVEREVSESASGHDRRRVLRYAYNAFFIWNVLTTYWVTNTAFIAGVVAILANGLLMCIPFLLYHQSRFAISRNLQGLAFIVYWITFEYLHMHWQLSWPWLTLGNAWSEFPSLVQWYEYSGVFGGSLWILWANLLFFRMAEQKWLEKQSIAKSALGQVAALILLPALVSLFWYASYEETGETVETVVVQPNFEPHYQKFKVAQADQLRRFLQLSEGAVTDSTYYIVYPETSFGRIDTSRMMSSSAVRGLRQFVDKYSNLHLVTGLSTHKIYKEGEPLSPAHRVVEGRDGKTVYWESYNSAHQFTSGEPKIDLYLKSRLVPGAEFFPYYDYLFFLSPIADALDGALILGTQEERSVFPSERASIGPIICYESIYGEYVTEYVRKGASILFIGTNDGWWDDTGGHKQHLRFASLRAIECRRSIARSANTGISALINQRGDILQPIQYGETAAIRGDLHLNTKNTFYVIWGDLIARLAIFASIILLLNTFVRSFVGGKRG